MVFWINRYTFFILTCSLHIFKCSSLNNDIFFISSEVHIKCFKMPFWDCTSIDSSNESSNLKKIIFKKGNIIAYNTSNTQHVYNTQAVQYFQDMSAAFAIYNNDESQNNNNESEKQEITSATRHAFQRNENNYNEITYTNLGEHFSPNLGNRRLVEQDNIVNREVLYRIEEDMRRINNILNRFSNSLDRILRCVQKNQRRVLRKPDCLPISMEAEMIAFKTINTKTYEEVYGLLHAACTFLIVKFQSVGGFIVKKAINLSFKEGIKDDKIKNNLYFFINS
ncbi:hypothetical protein ACFW04_013809 [Cataglyphis niger]